jgi:anti-sigma factor RsiW
MAVHHPLDIELMDLVEGDLGEDQEAAVREHVEWCLQCRTKVARLRMGAHDDEG